VSVTWCSRCRCPPEAHALAAADTERCAGNDAFEAGQLEAALLAYTRAISAAPGDAAAWSNRAAAFLALRRFPQALHDAQRAQQLRPDWAKPRARAAAAHAAMGQASLALAHCGLIHARMLTHCARAPRAVPSQHEEACRALRAALKLEPSNRDYAAALAASQRAAGVAAAAAPRAHAKARGDAAMARRDWDAACAAYTAALAAAPRDGAACTAAALCFAAALVLI
jgi:tetratricopeptide (TPR) repeat protein